MDEVDSILIDEARTPLIISGPAQVKQDQRLYSELKPRIQDLVRQQKRLCDKCIREANELITKLGDSENAEIEHEIGLLLYRVQQGQPKHSGLLEAKVDPANRRRSELAEMELHKDQTKKLLYAQKEELFFAIDEKSHDADLTEKGRSFLSPSDSEAFMMPDPVTAHHDFGSDESL